MQVKIQKNLWYARGHLRFKEIRKWKAENQSRINKLIKNRAWWF